MRRPALGPCRQHEKDVLSRVRVLFGAMLSGVWPVSQTNLSTEKGTLMSIITIAHGAYSGGNAIADTVAQALGYKSVDREVLIEASKRYGIPEAKYAEVLEAEGRWWERWRESLRLYRITLQAAMCEVAQGGQLVYHGRAGQQLLPGIGHVLRVLIVAPMDYRIGIVRAQKGMDEQNARQYIHELDRVRSRRSAPCLTTIGKTRSVMIW